MEDITAYLPYKMERCVSAMSQKLQSDLKVCGIDLPHSQYAVLRLLYENDGISQAQIARTLRKDTAAIKRTIDNLVKRGLARRVPNSGRDYKVILTEEAWRMRNRLLEEVDVIRAGIFKGIDDEDLGVVLGFIEKVMKNVGQ